MQGTFTTFRLAPSATTAGLSGPFGTRRKASWRQYSLRWPMSSKTQMVVPLSFKARRTLGVSRGRRRAELVCAGRASSPLQLMVRTMGTTKAPLLRTMSASCLYPSSRSDNSDAGPSGLRGEAKEWRVLARSCCRRRAECRRPVLAGFGRRRAGAAGGQHDVRWPDVPRRLDRRQGQVVLLCERAGPTCSGLPLVARHSVHPSECIHQSRGGSEAAARRGIEEHSKATHPLGGGTNANHGCAVMRGALRGARARHTAISCSVRLRSLCMPFCVLCFVPFAKERARVSALSPGGVSGWGGCSHPAPPRCQLRPQLALVNFAYQTLLFRFFEFGLGLLRRQVGPGRASTTAREAAQKI